MSYEAPKEYRALVRNCADLAANPIPGDAKAYADWLDWLENGPIVMPANSDEFHAWEDGREFEPGDE